MKKFRSLDHVQVVAECLLDQTFEYQNYSVRPSAYGYKFRWDPKSIKRFGVCEYKRSNIKLSKKLVGSNLEYNPDKIVDTILHEIAHAIEWILFRSAGHSYRWKSIASTIGCDAKQYYDYAQIKAPKSKYTLICHSCNRHRAISRKLSRSYSCSKCGVKGVYDPKYKMELVQNY